MFPYPPKVENHNPRVSEQSDWTQTDLSISSGKTIGGSLDIYLKSLNICFLISKREWYISRVAMNMNWESKNLKCLVHVWDLVSAQ